MSTPQPTVDPPTALPTQPASNPESPVTAVDSVSAPTATSDMTTPVVATPVVGGAMGQIPGQPISGSVGSMPPKKRRSFLKPLLASLVALVIVGGGVAAAYVGVIVPNKPANVLKTALLNSLQQQQVSFTGSVAGSDSGLSYKVAINGAEDSATKSSDAQLSITVSGVTFPIEIRLVDQNIYVKVGDLSSITSLINAIDPSDAGLVKSVSSQLSSKWIEIDSTLVNEAGLSCELNTDWTLSKADTTLLTTDYTKEPFTTINSSGGDTVNGQKTEKFNVTIDDNKLAAYSKGLNNLSVVKALNSCQKSGSTTDSNSAGAVTDGLADGQKTPLTIWVDKNTKRIVQVGAQSTTGQGQDASQVSGVLDFTYGKVSISAPANAESALTLLTSLETTLGSSSSLDLSQLLGSDSSGSTATSADNAKRQTDVQALQTQLEAFYSQNGYYPSLTDMNSASWRQTNMSSLDASALQDPGGSSQTLAATPAAHVYAYQVSNSSGGSCESNDTTCAQYTLTATYDGSVNGATTYVKTNLD
jgi:hypothetical protein